ncbi:MAG: GAF domain-containing protein [Ignavibacteriaceae bacterium]|nr:GAF domain-containing protein [Ignavibacteriaceae bacterium]
MSNAIKTLAHVKSNRLFDGVPESDLKFGVGHKSLRVIPEGDIIYQTGDSADLVYLILDGVIKMKFNAAIDGQRIFEKMKDDFFGEKEFLDNTVRTSSAVANTTCHVLTLQRKEINDLIARNRSILNNLQGISLAKSSATTDSEQSLISPELDDLLKSTGSELDPFSKTRESFKVTGEFSPDAFTSDFDSKKTGEFVAKEINFADTFESQSPFTPEQEPAPGDTLESEGNETYTFKMDDDIYEQVRKLEIPDDFVPGSEQEEEAEQSFSFDDLAEEPDEPAASFSGFSETAESTPSGDISQEESTFSWDFAEDTEESEEKLSPETPATQEPSSIQQPSGSEPFKFNWDQIEDLQVQDSALGQTSDNEAGEGWNFSDMSENETGSQEAKGEDDSFFNSFIGDEEETHEHIAPDSLADDITTMPERISWKNSQVDLTHQAQTPIPLIPGEHFTPSSHDLVKVPSPPKPDEVQFRLTSEQLRLIVSAAEEINSNIKIDEVLKSIVSIASQLTGADRGTLYIVDTERGEIWSKVIRGENIEEIRLRIGQGLSGWVAQTGDIVNIKDAHSDERFDPNMDKITGYVTRSVLCFPIINKANEVVAVLQLLNSKKGFFDEMDESFLAAMSLFIAITLENAELVEQIVRTDRLTSLGKVANFIISDIKKPILTSKQLLEHLKKKSNLQSDVRQAVNLISDQVGMVSDLIVTVLNYSQGKTILNKKIISGIKVVDEIIFLLGEYLGMRGIKVIRNYGQDSLLNVDKKELYQAMLQLAKNACDAMPGGGNLTIDAALDAENDTFNISVTDTGLGVPGSLQEKIFEPFMCHGKKHGVGLGLSIAEKIVKEHGGKITLMSEVGEGATFTISLPVVKGA